MSLKVLPERSTGVIFLETAICLLIDVTSFIGNILVCISVYRNRTLRTTTNYYLIALATADLLAATMVMPITLTVLVSGKWILGPFLCDWQAFFLNFVLYVSPSTMALTAFNRYIRIVKSRHYKVIFSKRRSCIMLGSAWLFVACYVSIPKLSGLQTYAFIPGYALCHVVYLSSAGLLVQYSIVITLFLLIPLAVAIICYIKVSQTICQHNLDITQNLQPRHRQRRHMTVHEIKVSKSLFVVVFAFVLCWIPAWFAAIVIRFGLLRSIPRGIQLFCSLSIYMSSAVNPFIYAGMNRLFRQEFKKILSCSISHVEPAATVGPAAAANQTPKPGASSSTPERSNSQQAHYLVVLNDSSSQQHNANGAY